MQKWLQRRDVLFSQGIRDERFLQILIPVCFDAFDRRQFHMVVRWQRQRLKVSIRRY